MSETDARKKKQMTFLVLAGAGALGLFVVMGLLMNSGPAGLPSRPEASVDETIINDRTSAASQRRTRSDNV